MENSTKQEYPSNVLAIIHDFVLGYDARNLDLRQPHLRPSVAKIYLFIVFMYSVLVVSGTCSNLAVLYHILRHKLQRSDGIYVLLLNNVVSDIVKCVFVVPLSLYVLLVQNWILGEHLCQCLPMFQDIPLHTTTLTFLLIAWDRLRYIRHPTKHRIPALVCAVGTWLTSVCLVLPYPLYVMYIDLGKYVPSYQGVGICIVNLADDMKEYMRGIFLIMWLKTQQVCPLDNKEWEFKRYGQ